MKPPCLRLPSPCLRPPAFLVMLYTAAGAAFQAPTLPPTALARCRATRGLCGNMAGEEHAEALAGVSLAPGLGCEAGRISAWMPHLVKVRGARGIVVYAGASRAIDLFPNTCADASSSRTPALSYCASHPSTSSPSPSPPTRLVPTWCAQRPMQKEGRKAGKAAAPF
ncbi:MAG: hypothetical protein ACPIOQ_37575 [Promethearchaeia archaeon]